MKVVVITGSPHTNGTSAFLAEKIIKGATDAGHEIYRFDAADMDVHPCIACEKCHGEDAVCVFKDDMQDEMTITVIAAGFGDDDYNKDIDNSETEETPDEKSSGMKEEVISVDNPLLSSLGLGNDKGKNNNTAPADSSDDDLDAILKMLGS